MTEGVTSGSVPSATDEADLFTTRGAISVEKRMRKRGKAGKGEGRVTGKANDATDEVDVLGNRFRDRVARQ